MENINCVFNQATSDYTCSIPTIDSYDTGAGIVYHDNTWSSGEMIIAFLLFLLLLFLIVTKLLEFVFTPFRRYIKTNYKDA